MTEHRLRDRRRALLPIHAFGASALRLRDAPHSVGKASGGMAR
jgi:transposase